MNRFDFAAQGKNDGLWDWDLSTQRIHFSPRWIALLGGQAGDFGNTPEAWFQRIHPEDLQSVRREIDARLADDSLHFEMQHRMLHEDGSYRWMACHGIITRDSDGRPVRVAGSHSDVTAEKVADPLTGLPNRLLLTDRLTRAIEIAMRRREFLFAVLIVDLDLSESRITRPGATDTELLIKAAARRMETCLRAGDTVARLGRDHVVARFAGDEFVVLVEGLNEVDAAKTVGERLLKEISAPFEVNGREVFLTASIGIALSSTGYRNAEAALQDAGTALHRAKALGKVRCEVFDTACLESAQAGLRLENDLQGALQRQELNVAYQPIVSLASLQISGFEALVRWKHAARGMISPADFIPVAERTGLIVPLGRWVLEQACRQLRSWKENSRAPGDLWISVNLSGVQFRQPSLVDEIRETLLNTGLEADGLMLELTEEAVMENPEAASSMLMQLRVMGVRVGLDDFGTGYSSLAQLRRLPLDYLKIDHSFVRNIESNLDSREIVRMIAGLAHQLGLRIIAEGIENREQLELIRSCTCEYGQGYFFSRAVSGEEAQELLRVGFTAVDIGKEPAPTVHESIESISPPIHASAAVLAPHSGPGDPSPEQRRFNTVLSRGPFLVGLTAMILLVLGGLLAKFNFLTTPPIAYSSPPAAASSEADLSVQERTPQAAKIKSPDDEANFKMPPVTAAPEQPRVEPLKTKKQPPPYLYSYPVVHDHVMGSCRGVLKITQDTLSFASEKEKDSFSFSYSDLSCYLDRDKLTIKAGSKTYRFKSASALTSEENRSQLQDMLQHIASLHKESVTKER